MSNKNNSPNQHTWMITGFINSLVRVKRKKQHSAPIFNTQVPIQAGGVLWRLLQLLPAPWAKQKPLKQHMMHNTTTHTNSELVGGFRDMIQVDKYFSNVWFNHQLEKHS